jgi:hypothetical protein
MVAISAPAPPATGRTTKPGERPVSYCARRRTTTLSWAAAGAVAKAAAASRNANARGALDLENVTRIRTSLGFSFGA